MCFPELDALQKELDLLWPGFGQHDSDRLAARAHPAGLDALHAAFDDLWPELTGAAGGTEPKPSPAVEQTGTEPEHDVEPTVDRLAAAASENAPPRVSTTFRYTSRLQDGQRVSSTQCTETDPAGRERGFEERAIGDKTLRTEWDSNDDEEAGGATATENCDEAEFERQWASVLGLEQDAADDTQKAVRAAAKQDAAAAGEANEAGQQATMIDKVDDNYFKEEPVLAADALRAADGDVVKAAQALLRSRGL